MLRNVSAATLLCQQRWLIYTYNVMTIRRYVHKDKARSENGKMLLHTSYNDLDLKKFDAVLKLLFST